MLDLRRAIRSEAGDYPVYVPTHGDSESDRRSDKARDNALASMTRLFTPGADELETVDAGILCASQECVRVAHLFNESKSVFKASVLAIRRYQKDSDQMQSTIYRLIRDEVTEKGYRTELLRDAMSVVGIASLDLRKCYAQIRIMPPELDVFSWTWAANHSRIKTITLDEAVEMATNLPGDAASSAALDLLSKCSADQLFAKRSKLAPQLRANYAYFEGGQVIRKSCPVSGIVIAQQEQLPRMCWRDRPEKDERRSPVRRSVIEDAPFIKALELHRYVR
jgi:hypothetical protein